MNFYNKISLVFWIITACLAPDLAYTQNKIIQWDGSDEMTILENQYADQSSVIVMLNNSTSTDIEVRPTFSEARKFPIDKNSQIVYIVGTDYISVNQTPINFNDSDSPISFFFNQKKILFNLKKITLTKTKTASQLSVFENAWNQTYPDTKIVQQSGGQKVIESLGGLDVTKFADGLAKFMVKRAKEELTVAFFENFHKELNKHPDIESLFPKTKATLDLIGEQIYNYERYLLTLRENFENDYQGLPDNIKKIIDNHPVYFNSHKELESGLLVGSRIAIGIRDKVHPGEILASISQVELKGLSSDVTNSVNLVQILSESFKYTLDTSSPLYWVEGGRLSRLFSDPNLLKKYVELLKEEIKIKAPTAHTKISGYSDQEFVSVLTKITGPVNRINALVKNQKNEQKSDLETITSYVDAISDLVATVSEAILLLKPDMSQAQFTNEKLVPFVKNSNSLVGNISKEKYSSALFNLIELYKLLGPQQDAAMNNFIALGQPIIAQLRADNAVKWKDLDVFTFINDLKQLNTSVVTTKYAPVYASQKNQVEAFIKAYPQDQSVLKWLTQYGAFMAAMISAENSDEVAEIIETYALPAGSAMIKRKSHFNIALNSFLGIYGGFENHSGGFYGVTAPVGLAFSWGNEKFGALSIFPALIDIGAIASFRFKDDDSQVGKILLKEIFSPGLFLSYGFRKLPISFNLGGQLAPLLERVGVVANDYNIERNWRFTASIVVDIPLLNFYNKEKK